MESERFDSTNVVVYSSNFTEVLLKIWAELVEVVLLGIVYHGKTANKNTPS